MTVACANTTTAGDLEILIIDQLQKDRSAKAIRRCREIDFTMDGIDFDGRAIAPADNMIDGEYKVMMTSVTHTLVKLGLKDSCGCILC